LSKDRYKKVPIPYTRIRELNVWTLSNFLSVSRVLLLPLIYLSLFHKTARGDQLAFGLLCLAALTDLLDGWIARLRHTISSFGKIIDPVADKICMVSVVIFLIILRGFPLWLFALILSRDVIIMLISALLIRNYKIVFPSNLWGKLYSFSLVLLIAAFTLQFEQKIIFQLEILVAGLLFVSSLNYSVKIFRYIRTHYRHQRAGASRRAAPGESGEAAESSVSSPEAD
jgi:CDP-diacylglycerol--glycerol-3-phosphate 3-phosphatidyltransferase